MATVPRRAAGLDAGDEQGGGALPSPAVTTDNADPARDGLFHFKSTRHDRLPGRRGRLRNRSAGR